MTKATTRTPSMLERYRKEIAPSLSKTFKHKNVMAVARLEKIVVNMGCGEAAHDAKVLEAVQKELALLTGQRPLVTRAKKAISNFKIREGDPVGCKVTLRRARMYEFLEKLVHVVLPRIRDFRGLSLNGFDARGNFSFGMQEQAVFPEVPVDQVRYPLGMDITFVIRTQTKDEGMALVRAFGVPFAKVSQPVETNGASRVA